MKILPVFVGWILTAVFFLALWVSVSGCSTRARPPAARSTAGSASIDQTGDAHTPAKASSDTQTASVPLPAGSIVTRDPVYGGIMVKLANDSLLHTETRRDTVTGPQAFTPPAPPTPADLANGRAAWVYRIALFIGIAAAVFGLVRGWDFVMWGGGAVAAAACVALFFQAHPILFAVIGGGISLAVAGVVIWHTKIKHTPFAAETIQAQ